MALYSMTGFARAAGTLGETDFVFEIKSVNGRGLEMRARLPGGFERLERELRDAATRRLKRGNLQIQLNFATAADTAPPRIDRKVLDHYCAVAIEAAAANGLEPPRIETLMALPGVFQRSEGLAADLDETAQDAVLTAAFATALDELVAVRAAEGTHLAVALGAHLDEIARLTDAAAAQAETQPAAIAARLAAQLADLLRDKAGAVPPERLAQEVALLAVKADVREEIDRLRAHVAEARKLLSKGEGVGRRLDFLAQEFNREANTLCSKSTDVELTRLGLDLKTTVDRLREQVQNVE
ncbi:YicC family protein [Zavarzinia compransoris]|uniref:YicC/YloC family endoribonuclease n=1 Tax=Zavarzinia marina TaxID=2911065 RepID=UPI001F30B66E|nr:YicC/YloC family endoribonuclease [Zavarzinia marina]MCF4164441.1 YicC family protein [Zavarzinia marina]